MTTPAATRAIAEFITGFRPEHVPAAAYRAASDLVINVVGITIGGATQPPARMVTDLVREMGGTGAASVAGAGFRTHPALAAYANGTAAHTLDMDDTYWPGLHHPSVSALPAVLALGESLGASGRDVLAAFVLGVEISCKLGEVTGPDHYIKGFHSTGTLGTFGALAGCAWLLGLDTNQVVSALGVAASLTAGVRENVGWMAKTLHAGNAAKNGLVACQLAARGFLGTPQAIEGEVGFVQAFNRGANIYPWTPLLAGLGRPWVVLSPGLTIKSSPCNTAAGVAGQSMIILAAEAGIDPAAVAHIEFGTNDIIPITNRYPVPTLTDQARYSVPFVIAVALLDGTLGPEQFFQERIARDDVQGLLRRVRLYVHDELHNVGPEHFSKCHLRVVMQDGRVHERWFNWAKGAPEEPLSAADLRARFFNCARFGLVPADLPRAYAAAAGLGELPTLAPLMDLVRGPAAT